MTNMKHDGHLTRREAMIAGLASIGGLLLSGCTKPLPPTYGNILRMGDTLTYLSQSTLLPGQRMAREYQHSDISSFPAIGTKDPGDPGTAYFSKEHGPIFDRLHKNGFANWQLSVEGRGFTRSRGRAPGR